jgi:RimJ/RimL family protein N-acetyltransferase
MSDPWAHAPTFSGRHVTLRPLQRSDRDKLLAAFSDGLEGAFTTFVPSHETIDDWFEQLERERSAGRAIPFCVLDAAGDVAGTTRFMRMSSAHRRLEIGGTLYARRVQRTGLNTEAKLMLLEHAFEKLGCNVVQLRTDWLNHQSRSAIERLGAKLDGILRGHLIMPDGHVRDTVVYSVVASEWPGVRANLRQRMKRYGSESP